MSLLSTTSSLFQCVFRHATHIFFVTLCLCHPQHHLCFTVFLGMLAHSLLSTTAIFVSLCAFPVHASLIWHCHLCVQVCPCLVVQWCPLCKPSVFTYWCVLCWLLCGVNYWCVCCVNCVYVWCLNYWCVNCVVFKLVCVVFKFSMCACFSWASSVLSPDSAAAGSVQVVCGITSVWRSGGGGAEGHWQRPLLHHTAQETLQP